jgi:ATP-dependent DNA helicase RecG
MFIQFFQLSPTLPSLPELSPTLPNSPFSPFSPLNVREEDDILLAEGNGINMHESTTIEFKREYNEKVIKTMLAFLNTEGGILYLGLSDDGTVYGIDGDIDLETRRITSSFRDSVIPDPSAYFNVSLEKRDGKNIIMISVERGCSVPYCFSKYGLVPQGVYVRIGSNTVMSTHEHIRQMIKNNNVGQYITGLSIEQDLTFECADMIFQERDVKFGPQQKQSLGLINQDGLYTNLALILSDQCPYTTKVAIFEGLNKDHFKDRKEFTGSVFKQIDDVLKYLHVYNRVHGSFEGAYRIDHSDYPDISLREAYVNSLIHRDYFLEGSVLVSMFDDRLEFMSLGGIMPGVTAELMRVGVSVVRNEKLAQVFYRLNMIEAFGTGIPRIFDAYENAVNKPQIPIIDGGFLIRIPNRNYDVAFKNRNGMANDLHEDKLLAAFPDSGFSKEEAAAVLNLSTNGAYKLLQRLKEKGFLTVEE